MMEIYPPCIAAKDDEWLQLEVINQWDFQAKPICFREVKTSKNHTKTISYRLYKCLRIQVNQYTRKLIVNPTTEIKDKLIRMGYTLNETVAV